MTSRRPFCAKHIMTRRPCLCTKKKPEEIVLIWKRSFSPKKSSKLLVTWVKTMYSYSLWLAKKKKSRATFLPNQKKTKLRKNRYHMITNDSYDRSLGFDKKVQRSHHYCFDSDVNHSRGFGLRPTQTPKYPAGRASGIQGIKMENPSTNKATVATRKLR